MSSNSFARRLISHHADAIGHALGRLSFARPRFRDGCFLYVTDRGLAHFVLTRRHYVAITFGHVIVFAFEPTDSLWCHEMRHVKQYERLGLAFLPLYLWLYAKHGYAAHPFERDAAGVATLWHEPDHYDVAEHKGGDGIHDVARRADVGDRGGRDQAKRRKEQLRPAERDRQPDIES